MAAEDFFRCNPSAPTHWPDWNLIVSEHKGTEFFYYAAFEKNDLIGLCPVHMEKKGSTRRLFSGQFQYIPYGGWIITKPIVADRSLFPIRGNESVSVFALPSLGDYALEWGRRRYARGFATLCIDLRNDEDWLWKNTVDAKRRNMIRKADKNQLRVEIVGLDGFDALYDLYSQANERNGLVSLSKSCLVALLFGTKNISFLNMIAWKEDRPLSAVVIALDKDYALYWLGAGAVDAPNLGQGEFLQWEAIRRAKRHGCKVYDLCYVEKERLPAIYEFKKGFSKDEYEVMHFNERSFAYRLLNRISK